MKITLPTIVCLVLGIAAQAQIFNPPTSIVFPSAYAIAAGDLNGDGRPDIVVGGAPQANSANKVYVSLNAGQGDFLPPVAYEVGTFSGTILPTTIVKIELADLNNDGHLDIVVGHNDSQGVASSRFLGTILIGNGNGTFQLSDSLRFAFVIDPPTLVSFKVGDLNGDSLPDLFLGCQGLNTNGYYYEVRNLGNGAFQTMGPVPSFQATDVAIGHFDRNTDLDVAVATRGDGVKLFFGNGNMSFTSAQYLYGRATFDRLITDDLNNDGRDDLVISDSANSQIRVLVNRNSSWPRFPFNEASYTTAVFPDRLAIGDLNDDGVNDVLVADSHVGGIQIFLSGPYGQLIPRAGRPIQDTAVGDVVIADFNGDELADFATINPNNESSVQVHVYLQALSLNRKARN